MTNSAGMPCPRLLSKGGLFMSKLMKSLPVIECKGCGACCENMGYPPFLRYKGPRLPAEPAWKSLPRRLKREVLATMKKWPLAHGPCIWLTHEGECRHYQYRPQVCREFEPGG